MKQTVEEAAKAFANKCYTANIKGGLDYPYDDFDMINAFEAGAELVLKEMSDHIRNNMSYNDKAWDILPFIEMIKGNSEPYIDYLRNKKAEAIQDINMNVIQQNISDIKE